MATIPYRIEYDTYRINRPNESLHKEVRNKRDLFKKIGEKVCQYTYNIDKELVEKESDVKQYNIYISFTKHTCCAMSAELIKKKIVRMYFSDIEVIKENGEYKIIEIKSYKYNTGNIPDIQYFANSNSTFGLKFTNSTNLPYKLPLIGISNKKVFLPPRSCFLEGKHEDLYIQPYVFDWTTDNDPYNVIFENLKSNPSDGFIFS